LRLDFKGLNNSAVKGVKWPFNKHENTDTLSSSRELNNKTEQSMFVQ